MSWIDDKGLGPAPWKYTGSQGPEQWNFSKQSSKLGYINNPHWTDEPASLDKHSPCGYWYNGDPGGPISPTGWNGLFFTVGPIGKGPDGDGTYDFGNFWDATQDPGVPDGSILLVYDYTRITNVYGSFSKNLFVRGVGETPISVYMSGESAYPSLWLNGQSNIIFENLHLIGSGLWHSVISGSSSDVTCIVNKCFLDPINENWCVEDYSAGSLTLRNCKLARYISPPWDNPQFRYCDLSKINLVGVEFYPNLSMTFGHNTGSFSASDYVEDPTVGYGYDYGDLIISDEFLAYYGYCWTNPIPGSCP
jgi:hypothetical protein